MEWEPVIGLEIHARLKTESKLFSPDSAAFSARGNDSVHPVSLGFPGTLPVLNEKAIVFAVKAAKAFKADIQKESVFARKNYFYPDLPKGYQISQSDKPLGLGGLVFYRRGGQWAKTALERIHIEEDAGRLLHKGAFSLADFNRAGAPLLEIVTLPEIPDPEAAAESARAVRSVLRCLEISDGNLEEGSMRCDCNISLRPAGRKDKGTKVELKNLNSFRFMEKALKYEIKRQERLLNSGKAVPQETRGYDPAQNLTFSLRSKEEAKDYRYFPDPDLLPLRLTEEQRSVSLPPLPRDKFDRLQAAFPQLKESALSLLAEDGALCSYFKILAQGTGDPSGAFNWMEGPLQSLLKEHKKTIDRSLVPAEHLAGLMKAVESGAISLSAGRDILKTMWDTGKPAKEIIQEQGLRRISDEKTLRTAVRETLARFPKQMQEYKEGKAKLFGFFVGQALKQTKGQADPKILNRLLKDELDNKSTGD